MTPLPITLRDNELTGVVHREVFDETPGDITDPADVRRWASYREQYHRAQGLEEFTRFPLQLDFELNSTCQMRCSFCVHGQQRVPKKLLPYEIFTDAIDEGQRHGLCSIKMNYINEPLLNRDLPRFVEYAKAHGVLNVYFASNGLLLTEDVARELIRVRVNKIMVSLDATTPETFMQMRHNPDFLRIVENVRRLLRIRTELGLTYPRVRVNFLKTKLNAHEAEDFIRTWDGVADAVGFQEQVGVPGMKNDFDAAHRSVKKTFRCAFPFKLMVIDADGQILPCCTFSGREMPMGRMPRYGLDEPRPFNPTPIEDAWNSAQMIRLKKLQQAGNYATNPICDHCVNNGGGDS